MLISSCFAKFNNFALLLLNYLKFYSRISDTFEFQKFWNGYLKAISKDKKSISQLPILIILV